MTSKGCCLRRIPCIIPVLGTIFVVGIFTAIIVVSEMDLEKRVMPWREGILIGDGFRTEAMKIIVPILRRCSGPKLDIAFFNSEDNLIQSTCSSPNPCGSALQSLFGSQSTEVVLCTVSSILDKIHAMMMEKDYVDVPIITSNSSFSVSTSEAELDSVVTFSVCVLPKFRFDGKIEVEEFANIPEMAAFFESWLFYGASEFFIYDLFSPQNESYNFIYDLYKDVTVIRPLDADKTLFQEKFPDTNLFYSFDCLFRSKNRSNFGVLTTFEDIPIVKTKSSLWNALTLVASSLNQQTINSVFQLRNGKREEPSTTIFNPLEVDSFNSSGNFVSKNGNITLISVPPELVETFNILQLGSALFQQPNNSAMHQVFDSWIWNYNFRAANLTYS